MRMIYVGIELHSDNEQMGLELEAKMPHQGQRPNMHIMRIYRLSIKVQRR